LKKASSLHSLLLLLLGVVLYLLDQSTKEWALQNVSGLHGILPYPFGGIAIINWAPFMTLSMNVVSNAGSAWGLFHQWPLLLLIVRLAILGALVVLLITGRIRKSWRVPMALVLAGAAGNVTDVIRYGAVVDFIHARFFDWSFPLFNVADALICIGVGWLFIASWKHARYA
jgi:signal peptidase II